MIKFKNNKERIAFLEDYRNEGNGWYCWKEDDDLDRKWWRYDLDDCSLIVEERLQTIHWPADRCKWILFRWYIISDWHLPFEDGAASWTIALEVVKEAGKKHD